MTDERRTHRPPIRMLARAAVLTGCLAAAGLAPAFAADDPALDQEIDRDQEIATDAAVLSDGHVDIGPRYVDGEWTLLIHDDSAEEPVWRRMDSSVFQISDTALLDVPDDDAYSFLPAPPGTSVHVVPQAQQPDVVWIGWNTQDPSVTENIDRGATLRLHGVDGPGELVMFLQSGNLGDPEVLWDSRAEYPQDVWVEVNTHTHANWVFSEPGVYLVEVEVTADLVTGVVGSDTQALRFAVGDSTSTDDALAAEYVPAGGAEAGGADDERADTADDGAGTADDTGESAAGPDVPEAEAASTGTWVLAAAGGGLLLVVVVIVVVLRGRAVKKRVEAELAATADNSTPGVGA